MPFCLHFTAQASECEQTARLLCVSLEHKRNFISSFHSTLRSLRFYCHLSIGSLARLCENLCAYTCASPSPTPSSPDRLVFPCFLFDRREFRSLFVPPSAKCTRKENKEDVSHYQSPQQQTDRHQAAAAMVLAASSAKRPPPPLSLTLQSSEEDGSRAVKCGRERGSRGTGRNFTFIELRVQLATRSGCTESRASNAEWKSKRGVGSSECTLRLADTIEFSPETAEFSTGSLKGIALRPIKRAKRSESSSVSALGTFAVWARVTASILCTVQTQPESKQIT